MTTSSYHISGNRDVSSKASTVTEYLHWVYEECDTGHWAADLTRPWLLYKVYRGAERLSLDYRFPLRFGSSGAALFADAPANLAATLEQAIAWMLYYTHGLTRIIRLQAGSVPAPLHVEHDSASPRIITGPPSRPFGTGRPVPSGGNLHPTEIYLVVGTRLCIPAGVYHYDCVHHALDLLRAGDYIKDVAACLPDGSDAHSCPVILLPAVFFQKNHQKYTNASYRLQALDTGVVVEQLRFMARRFGLDTSIYFQFLDQPVHHLLGLDPQAECVYAVLPLHIVPSTSLSNTYQSIIAPSTSNTSPSETTFPSHETILSLPSVAASHIQPFVPDPPSPLLRKLYASCLLAALPAPAPISPLHADAAEDTTDLLLLPPPNLPKEVDLADVLLRRRRTSFNSIDTTPLEVEELATVLAYAGQMRSAAWSSCDGQIYCAIARVNGIRPGVYRYSAARHALVLVNPEQPFYLLRRMPTAPNILWEVAPVNLFLAANHMQAGNRFGERGFRIIGLEAGRIVQRLSLATAACDLAGHPHLSFPTALTRQWLLRLPTPDYFPLITMMLGHPRAARGGIMEQAW